MTTQQILTLLRVNGLTGSEDDTVICAVLAEARFTETEVSTALSLLRDHNFTLPEDQNTAALRKISQTDQVLAPHEVRALLGVDMTIELPENKILREKKTKHNKSHIVTSIFMAIVIVFAILSIVILEYDTTIADALMVFADAYVE